MAINNREYSNRHQDGSGRFDRERRFRSSSNHRDRFERSDRFDRGYNQDRRHGFPQEGDGYTQRGGSRGYTRDRFGERSFEGDRRRFDDSRPQRRGDNDHRSNFDERRPERLEHDGFKKSFERSDRKKFDRGERSFDRGGQGFGRSDGGERRFDRHDRGERRFERNDRGFGRDERRSDRGGQRFDRRDEEGKLSRHHDEGFRSHDSARFRDRDGLQPTERMEYDPKAEFIPKDPSEPTIPAGVSGDELDAQALRSLTTLSGSNKDIVARHLVMAGELIDIDPEAAYSHAQAAAKRAGRVDVVREAAALTAYASGRYEEALREVRAVRRMRGDDSLRAVEADTQRGLGHPEKAIEIIDATDTSSLELSEQVELVLVSSGARADLGQNQVGLLLVDEALDRLPAQTDPELIGRLMSVKADRLRELGRDEEADLVEAAIPEVEEEPEIVDLSLVADVDVDRVRTDLRGSEQPLDEVFDSVLVDLDGVSYIGADPIEYAATAIVQARSQGMSPAFITNNSSRTVEAVADQLNHLGFDTDPSAVMTSAMDAVELMKEQLPEGATVLVVGGQGLRACVEEAGFQVASTAEEHPAAVVQGFDRSVGWAEMSEAAYAINAGAKFFATNLDITLPTERGFSLGNGSLVSAVERATGKRAIGAGKPGASIYQHGAELVSAEKPLAVGDRLDTDIVGAIQAGIPSMHVLTGVHQARDIITAPKGTRPSFLHRDLRGLTEAHPQPKHHRDGTWTCGDSQVAKVLRNGVLTLDDVELTEPVTVTLDSYRALTAAAWHFSPEGDVRCPQITVVDNDDPAGIVEEPETPHTFDAQDASVVEEQVEVDTAALEETALPQELPGQHDTDLDQESDAEPVSEEDDQLESPADNTEDQWL